MGSSNDRDVLLELFQATDGRSWKKNYGWNSSASLSTWYGVEVDENGRVSNLNLSGNDLEGERVCQFL